MLILSVMTVWLLIAAKPGLAEVKFDIDLPDNRPVIAAVDGWCPLACAPGSERKGLVVELLFEAYQAVGVVPNYIHLPMERAVSALRVGTIDGLLGAFPDEAPFAILSKEAVGATDFCFYSREGESWRYDGVASLLTREIAFTKGFKYEPNLDRFLSAGHPKVIGQSGSNVMARSFQMLLKGHVDSILEDRMMAHMNGFAQFGVVNSGCLNRVNTGYVAFSPANVPRSKRFKNLFDKGAAAVRSVGKLDVIASKYSLTVDQWFGKMQVGELTNAN